MAPHDHGRLSHTHAHGGIDHAHPLRAVCQRPECQDFATHDVHPGPPDSPPRTKAAELAQR